MALLVCAAFFLGGYFFNKDVHVSKTDPRETPIGGVTLPDGRTFARLNKEGSSGEQIQIKKPVEKKKQEGSSGKMDTHPNVTQEEILQREVMIPDDVKGKWKAVKLLIKNKRDEEKNEFRIVALGKTVEIGEGITATVGPFFPNFVMSELYYTSMNNQLLNPAIHLKIAESGKTIYDGWIFARYPDLYAFEHDQYAIQLTDYLPVEVS